MSERKVKKTGDSNALDDIASILLRLETGLPQDQRRTRRLLVDVNDRRKNQAAFESAFLAVCRERHKRDRPRAGFMCTDCEAIAIALRPIFDDNQPVVLKPKPPPPAPASPRLTMKQLAGQLMELREETRRSWWQRLAKKYGPRVK